MNLAENVVKTRSKHGIQVVHARQKIKTVFSVDFHQLRDLCGLKFKTIVFGSKLPVLYTVDRPLA